MKTFKNICTIIVVGTLSLAGIITLGFFGISAAIEHDRAQSLEWRAQYNAEQERLDKTIKFLNEVAEQQEQEEAAKNK